MHHTYFFRQRKEVIAYGQQHIPDEGRATKCDLMILKGKEVGGNGGRNQAKEKLVDTESSGWEDIDTDVEEFEALADEDAWSDVIDSGEESSGNEVGNLVSLIVGDWYDDERDGDFVYEDDEDEDGNDERDADADGEADDWIEAEDEHDRSMYKEREGGEGGDEDNDSDNYDIEDPMQPLLRLSAAPKVLLPYRLADRSKSVPLLNIGMCKYKFAANLTP